MDIILEKKKSMKVKKNITKKTVKAERNKYRLWVGISIFLSPNPIRI